MKTTLACFRLLPALLLLFAAKAFATAEYRQSLEWLADRGRQKGLNEEATATLKVISPQVPDKAYFPAFPLNTGTLAVQMAVAGLQADPDHPA